MTCGWLLGACGVSLLVAACSLPPRDEGLAQDDGTAVATFDLSLAPTDARCLVITATPQTGTVVTRAISLAPVQSTVYALSGLPTGTVTFTEQVFTQACSAIAGQSPTWIADPVTVVLQADVPVLVSLTLHRTGVGGQATVVSNFPSQSLVFHLFAVGGTPISIAAGPDGALWFTDRSQGRIGHMTTSGVVTSFPITPGYTSEAIVAGADGALWFAERLGNTIAIGRMSTDGAVVTFPQGGIEPAPLSMTVGADGAVWFARYTDGTIGRMDLGGTVSVLAPPTANSGPAGIAAGSDGNIWFTEFHGNKIGRVTPAGVFTEFSLPIVDSGPSAITSGPDGNVWFAQVQADRIARINPMTGAIVEFAPLLGPVEHITAGPDGNVWFTEQTAPRIGRITPDGSVTEFDVFDGPAPVEEGIAAGPDGNLWYANSSTGHVVQIDL